MNKAQDFEPVCKSVFKNGENTISKAQFTKMWIETVNKIEKSKAMDFTVK